MAHDESTPSVSAETPQTPAESIAATTVAAAQETVADAAVATTAPAEYAPPTDEESVDFGLQGGDYGTPVEPKSGDDNGTERPFEPLGSITSRP
ncbi:hypothetical protein GCM10010495_71440 [Kitasatospora herbaricolor]|uniref:hypothetical protein n=1 Tax=Kitasatospora herbaricolor TaxID=68217 RepID=UPI0017481511|nr:hypothetical protein [Kitasatospora herbaricolor]MDQ0310366.1 hypothetical protein [Kitasatospora herbaricolor]GGV43564.1 hypothetical protein GCM10010495_71440 [Kitasatospora herbaricolor]